MILGREWTGFEAAALRTATRQTVRGFADRLGVDAKSVTKWNSRGGTIRMLPRTQKALDTALKEATPDEQERFRQLVDVLAVPDTLDEVDRHEFLRTAALTATAVAATPLRRLLAQAAVPAVVDQEEIDRIRTAAQIFTSLDHAYGGGLVREAVLAQVQYSESLLEAHCTPALRVELYAAVGFLAHAGGFMAFDSYHHDEARNMFDLALSCAEKGGLWHLRAKVLSSQARQAIWCRDPQRGLTAITKALDHPDRLTATERAMLYTAQARAYAKQGNVRDTLCAIEHADREFSNTRPANDPAWMAYYDLAQHCGDTGHALYDLAIHGHCVTETRTRLATAVAGHPDQFKRSRGISATKLASLLMLTSDPAEAAAVGDHALTDLSNLRSRRAADDLRDLQTLAIHRKTPRTQQLSDRIGTTLAGV
ncbi:XRE family transcriptional regulator [Nocardia sp. NPDC051570]|uniref:XRE family transcriptional regulator n=1 Tax=Nocardia sp. NPDC051570 TaxID=3364324 RepID=UPI0037A8AA59